MNKGNPAFSAMVPAPLTRADAVAAFRSERTYREHYRLAENRIHALRTVLADGIARAVAHYRCPAALTDADDTAASLVAWARIHQLTEIVAFAPPVGPVRDLVPRLSRQLTEHTRSHFFRQVKGRPQVTQSFSGRCCFFTPFTDSSREGDPFSHAPAGKW